jgi:hypothetical protein
MMLFDDVDRVLREVRRVLADGENSRGCFATPGLRP